MATKKLKQIWNNVDGVAVAVAILEKRQRKFYKILQKCNENASFTF